MRFIATMGERHSQVPSYSYEKFADYVTSFKNNRIIVSSYSPEDLKAGLGREISTLLNKGDFEVDYCGCGTITLKKQQEEVIAKKSDDPDFVTKKNILEMIDTTVWTYLQSFWTSPEIVNSETTDSIFKTKRLMQTSFVSELESEIWLPAMTKTIQEIKNIPDYREKLILADVESIFFLKKALE